MTFDKQSNGRRIEVE